MNCKTLPKGYRQIEVMDFVRNRKQLLTVNIAAIVVSVIMVVVGMLAKPFSPTWEFLKTRWWMFLVAAAMYLAYIPLHELTHGLFMHALSGAKPKYGLKLCYAYAGSSVFFDRRSHGLIALAPLVLWGIVLFVLERTLPVHWFWLIYFIQITNVSGSMGDVYCALHLARLPRKILIQDSGVRMRVFAPRPVDNEESK